MLSTPSGSCAVGEVAMAGPATLGPSSPAASAAGTELRLVVFARMLLFRGCQTWISDMLEPCGPHQATTCSPP
jgi:hypothetical protein